MFRRLRNKVNTTKAEFTDKLCDKIVRTAERRFDDLLEGYIFTFEMNKETKDISIIGKRKAD